MDIDHIKTMVRNNRYGATKEFTKRMDQRGFSLRNVKQALDLGTIVEKRPGSKPYPKCTIRGHTFRRVAGIEIDDYLYIACAIGEKVIFITGYWKSDRPKKRRRP